MMGGALILSIIEGAAEVHDRNGFKQRLQISEEKVKKNLTSDRLDLVPKHLTFLFLIHQFLIIS